MLKLFRMYFQLMSVVSPRIAANSAFKVFQKIRIKSIRNREKPFYELANHFTIEHKDENLDAYELGNPEGKLIFLVHGWESNAGCLLKIAEEFVALDYRVIAFNLPGHAFHRRSATNLLECKLAFESVLSSINPTEPFDVVSHSFGAAVTANALADSNLEVNKLLFLTNPNKVEDIFKQFQEIVSLGDRALQKLLIKVNKQIGKDMSTMDVDSQLQKIKFDNLLMIHDEKDKILPYSNSVEIHKNVKLSNLFPIQGVGHYRMLWDEKVINKSVDFITS
jgi:pimeloyl-ACP methyl ester carboxylesterase